MFKKLQYVAYVVIIGQLIMRIVKRLRKNIGRADDYLD